MPTASRLVRSARRPEDSEPHVTRGMVVAAAWSWRLVVVAAGLAIIYYVLAYFHELLIPLLLALLLCALLNPSVDFLHRHRWPRILAVVTILLLTLLLIAGLLTLVSARVVSGFAQLSDQTVAGLAQVQDWLKNGPLDLSNDQLNSYITQAQDWVTQHSQDLINSAVAATGTAAGVLTGLFLVFFCTIFLLYDGRRVWSWVVHLLPAPAVEPVDAAVRRGWVTLVAYVRATIIVAAVDAIGIGAGAAILSIPLALPLGVLVFLGAFVPIVGALISGSVAVLIGLVYVGLTKAIIMLAIVLLVQQVEAHILQPLLLGRAVSVHPLAVVLGITAGTAVAGIAGAVFAVPAIAVANTVVGYLVHGDTDDTPGLPGAEQAPLQPDPASREEGPPPAADEVPEGSGPEEDRRERARDQPVSR